MVSVFENAYKVLFKRKIDHGKAILRLTANPFMTGIATG